MKCSFIAGMILTIFAVQAMDVEDYRVFDETTPEHVKIFYQENHRHQTLDFVLAKKAEYLPPHKLKLSIWEVIEILDRFVDESDPDLDLPQSYHFFQTAEMMRRDGLPRWMIITGFIHDLGKLLTTFGEPQWAVVGDTFPVGCAYSDAIVYSHYFDENPDKQNVVYQTQNGIYAEGCGWSNVHFSWGHDEYIYQVVKDYLPEEAGYIVRYHSFYPGHHEGAYRHLMNDYDRKMMPWLKLFQKYDLYSKDPEPLDVSLLKPYYEELISEFFPDKLQW